MNIINTSGYDLINAVKGPLETLLQDAQSSSVDINCIRDENGGTFFV